MNPARLSLPLVALWVLVGVVALALPIGALVDESLAQRVLAPFKLHIASDKALYSPLAYFFLLTVTFILERKIPVRERAYLSTSFWQDLLWYVGSMAFAVAFLGYFVLWLQACYHQYLSFLTVSAVAEWPALARFVLGVLVTDFMRWLSHLVRHKVPLFWSFHAVHHAQRDLNIFTDARVHPVDRMVSSMIRFIPMMMLGNTLPTIMAWLIFETIYPKFYHANIRLNLGPLRYLLVTPQSHRVHHGLASRYQDKNFGFTFCVWDRLFGTHYRDDWDYPATGIDDPGFPLDTNANPLALARTFCQQLIYPFRKISMRGRPPA